MTRHQKDGANPSELIAVGKLAEAAAMSAQDAATIATRAITAFRLATKSPESRG